MINRIQLFISALLLLEQRTACLECGVGFPNGDANATDAATAFLGRHDGSPMFPWNVVIVDTAFYYDSFSCLGTLIPSKAENASDIILTTANCFWSKLHRLYISAGFYKVLAGLSHDMQTGTLSVQAEKLIIIPFPGTSPTSRRDFGVLKTKVPIQYSSKVSPVCLPEPDESRGAIVDVRCFVSEATRNIFHSKWEVDKSMMRVFSPEACSTLLGDKYSSQFDYCSIGMEKKTSTRLGASLVCLKNHRWVMYGVHMDVVYSRRKISDLYEINLFSQVNPILTHLPESNLTNVLDESCSTPHGNMDSPAKKSRLDISTPSGMSEGEDTRNGSLTQTLQLMPILPPALYNCTTKFNDSDSASAISPERTKEVTVGESDISLSNVFKPDFKQCVGTRITQAPWAVLIVDKHCLRPTVVCSGSLLRTSSSNHSDVVLTAAQCVYSGTEYRYSVGAVEFTDPTSPADFKGRKIELRDTAAIRYNLLMGVHDHCLLAIGLAILKLKKPYTFERTRLPVSINEKEVNIEHLDDCYVTGASERGDILQASVKVLHPAQCKEALGDQFYENRELCTIGRKDFPEVTSWTRPDNRGCFNVFDAVRGS